jgi:hypothetical protein
LQGCPSGDDEQTPSAFHGCRFSPKRPFETLVLSNVEGPVLSNVEGVAEKRGLLMANGIGIDVKRLSPFALRSRRSTAASRRAATRKIDSPFAGGGI